VNPSTKNSDMHIQYRFTTSGEKGFGEKELSIWADRHLWAQ